MKYHRGDVTHWIFWTLNAKSAKMVKATDFKFDIPRLRLDMI